MPPARRVPDSPQHGRAPKITPLLHSIRTYVTIQPTKQIHAPAPRKQGLVTKYSLPQNTNEIDQYPARGGG